MTQQKSRFGFLHFVGWMIPAALALTSIEMQKTQAAFLRFSLSHRVQKLTY